MINNFMDEHFYMDDFIHFVPLLGYIPRCILFQHRKINKNWLYGSGQNKGLKLDHANSILHRWMAGSVDSVSMIIL